MKENLRIHPLCTILSPIRVLVLLPLFFRVLAVIEGRKWEICQLWNAETYSDDTGKPSTELSGLPEFRRFLDLRIELLVSQTMSA